MRSFPWNAIPDVTETRVAGPEGTHWNLARIGPGPSRTVTKAATPVLYIHGVLRHWRTFLPLIERLRNDFPLMGLDQRGHGLSSHASAGSYLVTDYVADLPRVLAGIPEPRIVLYGHSLGAMVALATAALQPDRIAGVILEDPPFSTMGDRLNILPLRRFFVGVEDLVSRVQPRTAEALFEPFSRMVVGEDATGSPIRVRDQRDELSRWFTSESLERLDPRVLRPITVGNWMDGYDLDGVLRGVRCPVALMQGDETYGGMLTDPDAERVLEGLGSRCERHPFPGCGHQLHGTRPDEVAQIVRNLIARCDA